MRGAYGLELHEGERRRGADGVNSAKNSNRERLRPRSYEHGIRGHEERPAEKRRIEYIEAKPSEYVLSDGYGEDRAQYRAEYRKSRRKGHGDEHARYGGAPVVGGNLLGR